MLGMVAFPLSQSRILRSDRLSVRNRWRIGIAWGL